eukprot:CAMPEP_0177780904 /NCGR_PEP_ID=MMETSP0491_2-20121128/17515_1 /TAXON_ID=63592 /ORGANISM="Tetraselmis chuii, Strain PLY429" /LENGTH=214 /DNA_ID=CAMNT_0019300833 /DNA_START=145 /DNA_END=788 /DNA_ORIENTATION=-
MSALTANPMSSPNMSAMTAASSVGLKPSVEPADGEGGVERGVAGEEGGAVRVEPRFEPEGEKGGQGVTVEVGVDGGGDEDGPQGRHARAAHGGREPKGGGEAADVKGNADDAADFPFGGRRFRCRCGARLIVACEEKVHRGVAAHAHLHLGLRVLVQPRGHQTPRLAQHPSLERVLPAEAKDDGEEVAPLLRANEGGAHKAVGVEVLRSASQII